MKRLLTLLTLLVMAGSADLSSKTKVACIGDSITYGATIENRDSCLYPAQLQRLMGTDYEVCNFGHNGATLIRRSYRPYNTLPEYFEALKFAPDIVVIHLGINDTDPRSWPNYSDDFIPDYRALMDDFRKVNPKVRIWICLMTPIFHGHPRFLSGTRDWHAQEQTAIRQIAKTTQGVGLIDLYTPLFTRADLFADNIHPDAEGAGIIARTVYGALTGQYGGLRLSPMYSDHMVLQRGKPLLLEGSANAGTSVEVTLAAAPGIIAFGRTETDSDGHWAVSLPPLEAGGPYTLKVGDKLFKDVWVGEVWLCSGQSNMEFSLKQCSTADEDLRSAGEQGRIHLFQFAQKHNTGDFAWDSEFLKDVNRLQYFNTDGWKLCDGASAAGFSAVGYHFGRVLADSLGCHVGLINCAVGGSTTESWCDARVLRWEYPQVLYDWYHGDFGQEWARKRAMRNVENCVDLKCQRHPYTPGYLFDAAIRPMERYPLRGILWYQGESNAHNVEVHADLFRLAVKSWREWWGDDLPVQMIQLSGIRRPGWPSFRNSQRLLAQDIEGVNMTVCSDLGHPTDVHPKDKKPVGERASWSALYNVYDHCTVVPSGPIFERMSVCGNALRLYFDFAEGLNGTDGFEIAGPDGIYHMAQTRIEQHSGETVTILVWSDEVQSPESVRYAWQPYPEKANLYNGAGMPCSTFKAFVIK